MMHVRTADCHVKFRRCRAVLGWLAILLLLPALASAKELPHKLSTADRAEIIGFQLNEGVLTHLQAVSADARNLHIGTGKSMLDMSKVHSIDDMAKQLVAADSRIRPMLAKHGFTPHQFLVANLALEGTAMTVQALHNPDVAKYIDKQKLNQHNLDFYKAHEAQIVHMFQQDEATAAGKQ